MRIYRILYSLLFVFSLHVEAQPREKLYRIGYLSSGKSSSSSDPGLNAFLQRLRELGYLDGKNISIEHRYAEGKCDRFPRLAAELVQLKVDVILTAGEFGVMAAKNATSTIPIVFAVTEDAVESGLVSSLARPGGNITGLTVLAADLGGKRLELLKESFPTAVRVAFLWPSGGPRGNVPLTEMETAAKALGLKLQSLPVRGPDDFERAFEAAKREGAQAFVTSPTPAINARRDRIVDFAAKNRCQQYMQPPSSCTLAD
jgi:putative ABC transport system substrate-binding protein